MKIESGKLKMKSVTPIFSMSQILNFSKMKINLLILLILVSVNIHGQLTIEDCREKARTNYPLVRKYDLINQSSGLNLQNASRGFLPQISLLAKATYQSEVPGIPISIPGIDVPTINKDQYQVIAEVNQIIWDGGVINSHKKSINAARDVEQSRYEVDMYALNERISDLFFGILLLDEQLKLNRIYSDELSENHVKIKALIANGIANNADLDAISVEQLSVSQRHTELETMQKAYNDMLVFFIGENADNDLQLQKPDIYDLSVDISDANAWNLRPEKSLFDAGIKQLEAQQKNISAQTLPRLSAFVQGGYGNPGLNMFKNEFSAFAIGGLRLTWNFSSFYTRKNDMLKINSDISAIEVNREIFDFNNRLLTTRQQAEITKYRKIIDDDRRIVELRGNIKRASEAKVENGTMSVTDLIRDISAEQAAFQNKTLHEIEMLKSIYNMKNILNEE